MPEERETYRNLLVRAAPGIHGAVAEVLLRRGRPGGAVMDLAAGSGALLARVRDAGFTDLSAVELDWAKFGLEGVAPQSVDLNTPFASQVDRQFDIVTATEIIEHLESPRAFLREVHRLLKPDGIVIVTTPNIADWVGRLKLLMTGELRFFDEGNYRFNHHISPITHTQMRLMLTEVGFELLETAHVGRLYQGGRGRVLRLIDAGVQCLCGTSMARDVNLYCARRAPVSTDARPIDWMAQ